MFELPNAKASVKFKSSVPLGVIQAGSFNLHVASIERLFRSSDCDQETSSDERILFCFPLSSLPTFLVCARQEVLPNLALKNESVEKFDFLSEIT